jgi:hypothetical protein
VTTSAAGPRRPGLHAITRSPGAGTGLATVAAPADRSAAALTAVAVPAVAVPAVAEPAVGVPAVAVLAVAVLAVAVFGVAVAGCSSGPAPAAAGTTCGHTRTAVGVPVVIMVAKGAVNCATALRVEAGYAAAIEAGDLRGNGGGAPVAVDGWTCESYPTQEVLQTGDASECHTTSAEVVAVLSLSSVSTSR